jgi:hypothetical protein
MQIESVTRTSSFHFHPEKLLWMGVAVLIGCSLLASSFLFNLQTTDVLTLKEKKEKALNIAPYSFTLALSQTVPGFSLPDLQDKFIFSIDPPRPGQSVLSSRLWVRLKHSGESKRVELPCRLNLEYQGDLLKFSNHASLFWLELCPSTDGKVEVQGWISSLDGSKTNAGQFFALCQECPLQEAREFAEKTPLRILAEAKWWGRDQFRIGSDAPEILEMGELIELKESDWLIWKEGKWQKSSLFEKEGCLAKIQSISPKMLILEAWEDNNHTRIALSLASGPQFKLRGEDLFSMVRIRSEKQISCMLEKQCMVLKLGDWVLKTAGRWKILRKKDEKDAFLNGKLFGELFILDQILQKQGQKMIVGRLFNPGRTQVVSIELAAQGRKMGAKPRRAP